MKVHPPYTEANYQAERRQTPPLACPDCGSTGDYGPRAAAHPDGTERHYRACKVCGFWQEADGSPAYRCWKSQHGCARLLDPAYTSPFCGQTLRPAEPEGVAVHTCGKYLKPDEDDYFCTTCGHWIHRASQAPWLFRGSG